MFCFCLQSSLLKLQALEVDGGCPSLGSPSSSPESSPPPRPPPPALGDKEGCRHHAPLYHRDHHYPPGEENSPPDLRAVLRVPPGEGEGQSDPGGPSRILHHITDGNSPLPSPRCPSLALSQRFNTDPEAAPSPPCSQQFILARGIDRTETPEDTKDSPSSIPLVTRHIQTLKRRIRKFEERFEQEMNYKPSHNDKTANPEMLKLMTELAKSRKQLKDLRLRQSVVEMRGQKKSGGTAIQSTEICRYGHHQQGAPEQHQTLEETVEGLLRRLREKRQALGLPDNMKEMSQRQMALEKITLQKCLLYFESLHGRPGTKQERSLVKPLYDRYQMVKHLLCVSPTITTIEEEEGSDEDYVQNLTRPPPPPCGGPAPRPVSLEDSDRDSDSAAFVSPLDEVKMVRLPAVTMSNLHEASRSELLDCLRETRAEKKRRRKALREFEEQFLNQTGRAALKDDRTPMAEEYQEYKNLKVKLRLLEVFLSKQET